MAALINRCHDRSHLQIPKVFLNVPFEVYRAGSNNKGNRQAQGYTKTQNDINSCQTGFSKLEEFFRSLEIAINEQS